MPIPSVEVGFDGWIFPRSGVAFVWVLDSELPTQAAHTKRSTPEATTDNRSWHTTELHQPSHLACTRWLRHPVRAVRRPHLSHVDVRDGWSRTCAHPGPAWCGPRSGGDVGTYVRLGWSGLREEDRKLPMSKGDIHTVKHGDGWANRAEGNERVSNTAATKAETQAKGREMAVDRGVEHVVHNQDGQISERNTYPRSRDPRRSKG